MHSLLKSKIKLPLFLLIALLTGSVLWLYINKYTNNSKATQPKVNVNFIPESATYPLNTDTKVNIYVNPANLSFKMSGIDLTLVASENATIVKVAPPVTSVGNDGNLFTEIKNSNNGATARVSYVITKPQQQLPTGIRIVVTIRSSKSGKGTLTVDPTRSTIVGNITGYSYDFESPGTGTYTFSDKAPTPTVNPQKCTTDSSCAGSETCDLTSGSCVAPTCPSVDSQCQTYYFSNHACVISNKSNGTVCNSGTCLEGVCVNVTKVPTSTPTQVPSVTLTPTPTQSVSKDIKVNMKLRFQGITRKPVAVRDFITKITLMNTNSQLSITKNAVVFTIGDDGIWRGSTSFNAPAGDGYYFLVKGPMHVQKKICESDPTESIPGSYRCGFGKISLKDGVNDLDFSNIYELVGDLPEQNGVVDSYDISFIRLNLGKNENAVQAIGDINLDGRVDTQDYSLVIASLSVKKDEE